MVLMLSRFLKVPVLNNDWSKLTNDFLTGILRIAQESIFSGLNLTVNSVMDEEYDAFFGFTQAEVERMLAYYGGTASQGYQEIRYLSTHSSMALWLHGA